MGMMLAVVCVLLELQRLFGGRKEEVKHLVISGDNRNQVMIFPIKTANVIIFLQILRYVNTEGK